MKSTSTFFYIVLLVCCLRTAQAAVTLPVFPSATFPVTSYGAASSTTKDNTSGIQKAIDACTAAGGGTVVIPSGTYLSGPLTLKNNVNLQISGGATLRLLPYGNGNGSPAGSYPNSGTADTYVPLIYAKGVKNIAVSGSGTIDGQGAAWWAAYLANRAIGRPGVIRFDGCTTIAITGITIINAPNVHITIGQGSNNSTVANVTINSPSTSPNTDGIDTWSPNINITNCSITCGDDNIAMDSESQNVTIKHCTFGTGHGCSIGSFAGNISNILVDSCTFNGTTAGMRLKTARNRGDIETNITYSNITMTGVTNPVSFTSYYPSVPSSPTADPAQAITASTPTWNNIILKNAVITGSANAGLIWGLPELSISTVTFDNVQISAKTGMKIHFATGVVFKNCSQITVTSGNAIASTYNASASGIDFTTGKPTYSISISESASPGIGGTVAGAGSFACGANASVVAKASTGYVFSNWTEGGKLVSASATYTFKVTGNRTLVANFIASRKPATYVYTYDNSGNLSWSNANSWAPKQVPLATDTTIIRSGEVQIANLNQTAPVYVETNGILRLIDTSAIANLHLQGGTLKAYTSSAGFVLTGAITVEKSSTIMAGSVTATIFTLNGTITGSADLTKTSVGNLRINSTATGFKGNWIITEGKLQLRSATGLGVCGVQVKAGARLDVEAAASIYSLKIDTLGGVDIDQPFTVDVAVFGKENVVSGNYTNALRPAYIAGTNTLKVKSSLLTSSGSTVLCAGATVVLQTPSSVIYSWKNGAAQVGAMQQYTASTAGDYTVEVTNANGCKAVSVPKTLHVQASEVWYKDEDNDGKGNSSQTIQACIQPTGYVPVAGDDCPADANKTTAGNCGCGHTETSCLDCSGVPNGTAVLDNCNLCVGGNTGNNACVTTATTDRASDIFSIAPQPFDHAVTVLVKNSNTIQSVIIVNSVGTVVESINGLNSAELTVGEFLTPGFYVFFITSGKQTYTVKVIKK